jgi:hypothetical protein
MLYYEVGGEMNIYPLTDLALVRVNRRISWRTDKAHCVRPCQASFLVFAVFLVGLQAVGIIFCWNLL